MFLVGMPGSGKTAVGEVLAERLGVGFVDLDGRIEHASGRSIGEIFTQEGEAGFRRLEGLELRSVVGLAPAVVACGGGVVLDPGNVGLMRETGTVVYLDTPPATLAERLRPYGDRPLLRSDDDVGRLLRERSVTYRGAADLVVEGAGSPDEVAAAIEGALA